MCPFFLDKNEISKDNNSRIVHVTDASSSGWN